MIIKKPPFSNYFEEAFFPNSALQDAECHMLVQELKILCFTSSGEYCVVQTHNIYQNTKGSEKSGNKEKCLTWFNPEPHKLI